MSTPTSSCCGVCNLPDGTAYVTADHTFGVVGHDYNINLQRPLEHASMDALYAMQDAIRRESAHR